MQLLVFFVIHVHIRLPRMNVFHQIVMQSYLLLYHFSYNFFFCSANISKTIANFKKPFVCAICVYPSSQQRERIVCAHQVRLTSSARPVPGAYAPGASNELCTACSQLMLEPHGGRTQRLYRKTYNANNLNAIIGRDSIRRREREAYGVLSFDHFLTAK